ncbi:hypothetical protein OPV22_005535 [Ensete ventricosum]|uniref:TCP domain-containing protein n=1 Tax=Ensete ventricosum TaxID=4639 RepID=A0AAV8RR60_ENSVE|nr:hypothetical protein OPV22_005535 [Ensete ventricosum]
MMPKRESDATSLTSWSVTDSPLHRPVYYVTSPVHSHHDAICISFFPLVARRLPDPPLLPSLPPPVERQLPHPPFPRVQRPPLLLLAYAPNPPPRPLRIRRRRRSRLNGLLRDLVRPGVRLALHPLLPHPLGRELFPQAPSHRQGPSPRADPDGGVLSVTGEQTRGGGGSGRRAGAALRRRIEPEKPSKFYRRVRCSLTLREGRLGKPLTLAEACEDRDR